MSDEILRALERREAEAPDDALAADAADRERARAGQPTRRAALLERLAFALSPARRLEKLRRDTNQAVENVMRAGVRHRAGRSGVAPEEQAVAVPLVSLLVQDVPTLDEREAERIANAVLDAARRWNSADAFWQNPAQRVAAQAVRLARLALIDARERGPGSQAFSDAARIAFSALARAVGPPLAIKLTGRTREYDPWGREQPEGLRERYAVPEPWTTERFPPRSPAQEHRESPDRHRDLRP